MVINMRWILVFIYAFLSMSCSDKDKEYPSFNIEQDGENISGYPEFSWDKVPVCIHLYKDYFFADEDIEFISRFPIVCIEKAHAMRENNNAGLEENTILEAKRLQKANPKIKTLLYWNSVLDYGDMYKGGKPFIGYALSSSSDQFKIEGAHPEWALKDTENNLIVSTQANRCNIDITIDDASKWWLSVPEYVLSNKEVNGVFVDKVIQYSLYGKQNEVSKDKADELWDSYSETMKSLQEQSPDNALIIANALRGREDLQEDFGVKHLEFFDGAMIEHFCDIGGKDKDVIVNDIALIQKCAEMKKVVIVKGWPTFNFTDTNSEWTTWTEEQRQAKAKEDIVFPLAAFLVAAGEYAYFCYSWGYEYSEGGMIDYPEYNKKLGKPLDKAFKNGYCYSRDFEFASVEVDVENRTGKIVWK